MKRLESFIKWLLTTKKDREIYKLWGLIDRQQTQLEKMQAFIDKNINERVVYTADPTYDNTMPDAEDAPDPEEMVDEMSVDQFDIGEEGDDVISK